MLSISVMYPLSVVTYDCHSSRITRRVCALDLWICVLCPCVGDGNWPHNVRAGNPGPGRLDLGQSGKLQKEEWMNEGSNLSCCIDRYFPSFISLQTNMGPSTHPPLTSVRIKFWPYLPPPQPVYFFTPVFKTDKKNSGTMTWFQFHLFLLPLWSLLQ